MRRILTRGATSVILHVFIQDSTSASGGGLTGLTSASSGLNISYIRPGEAAATTYTAAGSTIEAVSVIGTYAAPTATKIRFSQIDATNLPGLYEIQAADAVFNTTSGRPGITFMITGATNMVPVVFEVDLDTVDLILTRDMSLPPAPSSTRAPINALRKLMNKVAVSGGTLTVYKEDDATSAFTQAVTTDSSASPITSVDTA